MGAGRLGGPNRLGNLVMPRPLKEASGWLVPSAWGSVDGDQIFSPFFVGGLLIGDSNKYKQMNKPGNILHTVNTARHPTHQHHNSYNRTDIHRQWNAVSSSDDGHKDARNMLR